MLTLRQMDLRSGYHQIALSQADSENTAFSMGRELWQFRVMPGGLCNVPATFEYLLEQVLAGPPTSTALVHLDDILAPAGHSSMDSHTYGILWSG